jgi:hypothetical protein
MSLPDALEAAVARSRLVDATERSLRTARVTRLGTALLGRVRDRSSAAGRWPESAAVLRWGRRGARVASRAAEGAQLSRAAAAVVAWTESAFLYRWLTAEPDPEVVVIDLRETLTVGPFLVVLDRWLRTLAGGLPTSGLRSLAERVLKTVRDAPVRLASVALLVAVVTSTLAAALVGDLGTAGLAVRLVVATLALLGSRVGQSWPELRETPPVRLFVAALEPPPPPEAAREEDRDADQRAGDGGRSDERS